MGKELPQAWEIDHPECVPFIDGYRKFLVRHKVILIQCAFEVVNEIERYTGHPDQLVMLDGVCALIDIKTGGMPPICNLQLASYEMALRSMLPEDQFAIRVGLQLTIDGGVKLHYFTDPRDKYEWTILVRAWHIRNKYVAQPYR